jgi:hypothetical protein
MALTQTLKKRTHRDADRPRRRSYGSNANIHTNVGWRFFRKFSVVIQTPTAMSLNTSLMTTFERFTTQG